MKKFLFILLLGLQACGQTGPLYLPDQEPPIHTDKEKE
jgi:predicted small lipoprotein YifL